MPDNFDVSIIIRCFTTEHMERLKREVPGLTERLATFEEKIEGNVENQGDDYTQISE